MFKVKIVVTNRKNIIELSKIINSPCAIISISGSNEPMPDIIKNPFILYLLELHFDDVEEDWHNEKAMTFEDAENIVNFVKQLNDVDTLYVHCGAGISRSAGVAAAISKALTGDDTYFFERPFCPNMNCYKLTLKAFGLDTTPMELLRLDNKINECIRKELE